MPEEGELEEGEVIEEGEISVAPPKPKVDPPAKPAPKPAAPSSVSNVFLLRYMQLTYLCEEKTSCNKEGTREF